MVNLYLYLSNAIRRLPEFFARPGLPLPGVDYQNSVLVKTLPGAKSDGKPFYLTLCLLNTHAKSSGIISGWRDASANNGSGTLMFSAGSGNGTNSGATVLGLQTQVNGLRLVTLSHGGNRYIAIEFNKPQHQEFNTLLFRGDSTNLSMIQTLEESLVTDVTPFDGNGVGATLLGGAYSGNGSGIVNLDARELKNLVPVANLPLATKDQNGAITKELFTKLINVAAGATQNQTDEWLTNRKNHHGKQSIDTITGLQAALDDISQVVMYEDTENKVLSIRDINLLVQAGDYLFPEGKTGDWLKLILHPSAVDRSIVLKASGNRDFVVRGQKGKEARILPDIAGQEVLAYINSRGDWEVLL